MTRSPEYLAKHRLCIKSFKGHISRLYCNMRRRVLGKGCKSPYLYVGKEIMSKEDFYIFATNSLQYKLLWEAWKEDNYNRLLTPSVNRIDNTKGYTIDNIEFITTQENCKLSHIGRVNYRGRFSK